MQPPLPQTSMDPTYPGLRHTFEPVRHNYTVDDELQARTGKEVGRMPYQGKYDAAIRGMLNSGQPRPLA